MSGRQSMQRAIGAILVILSLIGCASPAAAPAPSPALPPPPPGARMPPPPTPSQPAACRDDERAPMGILRSTDRGETWTSLGNACLKDSSVAAADPTGFVIDGRITLYFLDLNTLVQDNSPATQRIIYRATSVDGVHFDTPQPAYIQNHNMVDPFVLRMPDGSFRMYFSSEPEGIRSAVSRDGRIFTPEEGIRTQAGAMAGALLLPDHRVRLFLGGSDEGKAGILSLISDDGLNFTIEPGLRIPAPSDNTIVDNPQPIQLTNGSYLMLYGTQERKFEGLPPWEHTELRLAASTDGFNWNANPRPISNGSTSVLVEASDSSYYIYYVNEFPRVPAPAR